MIPLLKPKRLFCTTTSGVGIGALHFVLFLVCLLIAKKSPSQPPPPQTQSFRPISEGTSTNATKSKLPALRNGGVQIEPHASRNPALLQQSKVINIPGATNQRQVQQSQVELALSEDVLGKPSEAHLLFANGLRQFLGLNPDNFSVAQAVYISEKAFDPNLPPYPAFENEIKEWAELVRQILKREGLSLNNNVALNYGIQKLFTQYNSFYNKTQKTNYSVPPIRYDFRDFMGEQNWSNMFVSKLLRTKSGQCHSLPLFFLCVAEKLGAKAWLSLSPNHSFIQYLDEKGGRYNFETTNGSLVTHSWLMQSTFVNATALKNKTYLDTLSSRKLYAQCMSDLLLGYLTKAGYDSFSEMISEHILSFDTSNVTALMTQANYSTFIFKAELNKAGNPPRKDLDKFPLLKALFEHMQLAVQKVERTGYQEMPSREYQNWLRSLQLEKQKQAAKAEQQRLQEEIKSLKKLKSTLIIQPKK